MSPRTDASAWVSRPTPHPKLRIAKATLPENGHLHDEVEQWLDAAGPRSAAEVRARLRGWVYEYAPAS